MDEVVLFKDKFFEVKVAREPHTSELLFEVIHLGEDEDDNDTFFITTDLLQVKLQDAIDKLNK